VTGWSQVGDWDGAVPGGDWVVAKVGDWTGQCTVTGLEPRSATGTGQCLVTGLEPRSATRGSAR
jgi:hypothetical protein